MVAELAVKQRKQAAVAHRQQEELRDETERHLRRMEEMATLLQAWTTPPLPATPECTDGGKQWMSC